MKKLILAFVLLFTVSLFTNCTSETENNETIYKSNKSLEKIVSENSENRISAPPCENRGFKPEPSVPEGSCCMEFNVLESTPELPWAYWFCIVEEQPNVWVQYSSSDYPEGIFKVCFEEDDQFYQYSITYIDAQGGTVCESRNQLVYNEKGCEKKCCEDLETTFEWSTATGCCSYIYTIIDDSDCILNYDYNLVGNPSLEIDIKDGNVIFSFEICNSGDEVEIFIYDSDDPSKLCRYDSFGHSCAP